MKVLLSWLREFAPIEGDPAALAEHLSDLGTAVEKLDVLGRNLDGVVVARVLATRPHPNADKVQLVDVDAGDGGPGDGAGRPHPGPVDEAVGVQLQRGAAGQEVAQADRQAGEGQHDGDAGDEPGGRRPQHAVVGADDQ